MGAELIKLLDLVQPKRSHSGAKKKSTMQQSQKNTQQKQQQYNKKDKPSSARSESSGASEDPSDNGRGEISQSSPSPALSTNTNHSSNSSASSPAHNQDSAVFSSGNQNSVSSQMLSQQGYLASTSKEYFTGGYQQQQGAYVQTGLNPLLLAQGGMLGSSGFGMGHHPGLSPVMILQRNSTSSSSQTQQSPHYYTGGKFNQHRN